MKLLPSRFALKLRSLFRRRHVERELADEFAFHLGRQAQEFEARGMSPADAARAARRALADQDARLEECRDLRPGALLASVGQDVRYALRGWRRRPLFAGVVILMLTLGIGATTTVFALSYAELWRPLPLPHADRLVAIAAGYATFIRGLSPTEFQLFTHAPGLAATAAHVFASMTLVEGQQAASVPVQRVTPNLLPVLEAAPELGRNFLPAEARAGQDGEALISDRFWRMRFGANPDVLGQKLRLDQRSYTVIGILPAQVNDALAEKTDVWLPLVFTGSELAGTGGNVNVLARLQPRESLPQARRLLAAYAASLGLTFRHVPVSFEATSLVENRRRSPGRSLLDVLLAAVGLVLLIVCANVAGLLLARGFARRQEMAVRQALGAGRARLMRQLLTEGLLLAAVAGAGGTLIAQWDLQALQASPLGFTLVRLDQARLDVGVLAFSAGLTALCAIVFSLAPALQLSRSLRDTGYGSGRSWLRSGFLVAEVALTLVLLVGAGLMARSLERLVTVRTGLDEGHLGAIEFQFTPQQMRQPMQIDILAQQARAALQGRPGWRRLAIADAPPFDDNFMRDYAIAPLPAIHEDWQHVVGPNYFTTVGQRLLLGRGFDPRDTTASPDVVIVNQAWVRKYSPGASPLGLRLSWANRGRTATPGAKPADTLHQIVGVAADVFDLGPDISPLPELYLPYAQTLPSDLALVFNAADPAAAVRAASEALAQAMPDLPIAAARPVAAFASDDIALPRFQSWALIGFAGLALLFALSGIWALVAFAVQQRQREFGIRMALGAAPGDILRQALRQALGLTALGAACGLAGAWIATRWLAALLFEVRPTDAATFAAVTLLFALVAAAAAYWPARRALDTDPAATLRCE